MQRLLTRNKILSFIAMLVLVSTVSFFSGTSQIAHAAISRTNSQDATANGSTTVTATYPTTPTSGDLLIAIVYAQDGGSGLSTTPAGWTFAYDSGQSSGDLYMYYKVAGALEPTTVTFTDLSAANLDLAISEYTGNATVSPLDKTAVAASSGLTCNTGTTAATTQASEISIGAAHWNVTQAFSSWSNSYVAVASYVPSNSLFTSQLVLSSTGTQTTTVTVTGTSSGCVGGIATFKAATAVVSTDTRSNLVLFE